MKKHFYAIVNILLLIVSLSLSWLSIPFIFIPMLMIHLSIVVETIIFAIMMFFNMIPYVRNISQTILMSIAFYLSFSEPRDFFTYLFYITFAIFILIQICFWITVLYEKISKTENILPKNSFFRHKQNLSEDCIHQPKVDNDVLDTSIKQKISTKYKILSFVLIFFVLSLGTLNIIQYSTIKNRETTVTDQKSTISELKKKQNDFESEIRKKDFEISSLSTKIADLTEEVEQKESSRSFNDKTIDFYEKYVAVVPKNGDGKGKYHTYRCISLFNYRSNILVYWKDDAKKEGYKPCNLCEKK